MKWLLLVLAVVVVGCAGSGGGGRFQGMTEFVGQWSGTWEAQDQSMAGATTFTVDNRADLLGTINHPVKGVGAIDAWCDTDGEVSGSLEFPGEPRYSLHGDIFKQSPTTVVGNFWIERDGEDDVLYIINVSK